MSTKSGNLTCSHLVVEEELSYCSEFGNAIVMLDYTALFCLIVQMWISKAEYDESGPAIVHRKCF